MFVVSFYSYKGGVGRSVSLLNSAWSLAASGSRVALLDLDLEAPGLHEAPLRRWEPGGDARDPRPPECVGSFYSFCQAAVDPARRIETLDDARDLVAAHLTRDLGPSGRLALMPARTQDDGDAYADFVDRFSWSRFYQDPERPGKLVLTQLITGLSALGYDYLFVDARTGLTDVRGPSLLDIPDLVVMVSNLSAQSAAGIQEQRSLVDQVNKEILDHGRSRARRPGRDGVPIRLLFVGSMLPVGELDLRRRRLAELEADHGLRFDVQIDYLPLLALGEQHQVLARTVGASDSALARALLPYEDLAHAIRRANPHDPDNVLRRGDEFLALSRWREALAHYDWVVDRFRHRQPGQASPLFRRAWASSIRAQVRAPVQVDQALDRLREAPEPRDGSNVDGRERIDLHLAAAWSLVLVERYEEAVEQSGHAWEIAQQLLDREPGQASLGALELAGFVHGQNLRFVERWTDAASVLVDTDQRCRTTSDHPLLHVLVLVELARIHCQPDSGVVVAEGWPERGVAAHQARSFAQRAQTLVDDLPIESGYARARVQLALGEVCLELGRGREALGALRGAYRGLVDEVDFVGALEALGRGAAHELDLDGHYPLPRSAGAAAETSASPAGDQVLETWVELARKLQILSLADELAFTRALRSLGRSSSDGARALETLRRRCRGLLDPGAEDEAPSLHGLLASLPPAEKGAAPMTEARLLLGLLAVAEGADPAAALPDAHLARLQHHGFVLRLVQGRAVRALAPDRSEDLDIAVDLGRALDLDGWTWNGPVAFAASVEGALAAGVERLRGAGLEWPLPAGER